MSELIKKRYMFLPSLEDIGHYEEGGYHPVHLGNIFNDRYLVVNKLGFATSSTVWLVEDLHLRRFASLKVLSARRSEKSSEILVVKHLTAQQERLKDHPGREHVVQFLDTFMVQGPNGKHHCIVMELLGTSLSTLWLEQIYGEMEENFPQNVGKKIAAQVALGVAYLHKCGVIHGDLHLGNTLFYASELQSTSLVGLNEIYGEPKPRPIFYDDGSPVAPSIHHPRHVVIACDPSGERLQEVCLLAETIHVKLCDFGEASIYEPQPLTDKPLVTHMPLILRAPEIMFNDISAPTFAMEMWSLGVILFMILNRRSPPFWDRFSQSPDGGVVRAMVYYIGKLPDKWWTRWTERALYYDENGMDLQKKVPAGSTSDRRWVYVHDNMLDEEEASRFTDMLWKIFRYDPAERIDAEEVVRLIPEGWKQMENEYRVKAPGGVFGIMSDSGGDETYSEIVRPSCVNSPSLETLDRTGKGVFMVDEHDDTDGIVSSGSGCVTIGTSIAI